MYVSYEFIKTKAFVLILCEISLVKRKIRNTQMYSLEDDDDDDGVNFVDAY